jgi:hypothetical protein
MKELARHAQFYQRSQTQYMTHPVTKLSIFALIHFYTSFSAKQFRRFHLNLLPILLRNQPMMHYHSK